MLLPQSFAPHSPFITVEPGYCPEEAHGPVVAGGPVRPSPRPMLWPISCKAAFVKAFGDTVSSSARVGLPF